jgi:non-specific serine/threonine protein kinase
VGRRRELGELRDALEGTRLLTLTGPGGCGKTRLGLQFASEAADSFTDGVWWVDLASLAEERLVAATLAESLEVRPLPGLTELQAVCGYLAQRRARRAERRNARTQTDDERPEGAAAGLRALVRLERVRPG